MKVTAYQTAPLLLDIKSNLADVISKIHRARENGAHLVVFPELAVTGYFVRDRYHEAALRLDSDEIKSLAAASKGTAAVVGFIEESLSMNFYNSALVLVDGEIVFAYRKRDPAELLSGNTDDKEGSEKKKVASYRFWGGSEIVNPFGKTISKAALYEPDEIDGHISRDLLRQKKILLPYVKNDDPYFTYRELQRILFKTDSGTQRKTDE